MNDNDEITASTISGDLTIDGHIHSNGSVVIMGTVNGNVTVGTLVLADSGKIRGNIKADEVELKGNQRGKVVSKKLAIVSGAVVNGSVACEDITVESGAHISGKYVVAASA